MLSESTRWSPTVAYIARDFIGPVLDLGHILKKHRPPIEYADHQVAQLASILERFAGIHADQAVAGTKITCRLPDICDLNGTLHLQWRNVIAGHPVRVHEHLDHAWPTSYDIGPRNLLNSCQALCEFLRHAAQRHVARRLTCE